MTDPMAIERALLIETLRPALRLGLSGPDDRGQFYISAGNSYVGWLTHGWCYRRSTLGRWRDGLSFEDALAFARDLAAGKSP